MKNMIKLPALLVGLLLIFAGTTQTAKAQQQDVSLQSFYDELSPYGVWIKDPQYGYVWRPDVDQDEFRPYYTNGRWAMTEYGNTWVSNYDWGWAPFHYGRWVYNRYNSWVWVPDTVWGPAWVTWRSGGGNYGWAPLGPSINIGINFGRGGYRIPDMCWNFVPYNNIYYDNYPRYYSNRNRVYIQNTVIINNTYVNNNKTYYTGPRADDVRRRTNQNVTVYNVNTSNRPGASRIDNNNNNINIYNPRPSRESNNVTSAPRDAVQGSINRGTIASRNTSDITNSRSERGGSSTVYQNDRNATTNRGTGNMSRPARGDRDGVTTLEQNRDLQNRSGSVNPQRAERGNQSEEMQRVERNREMNQQQNTGRSQPVQQQRVERPQPAQEVPQQRMERTQQQQQQTQPQQQQRTERTPPTQQVPQQRMERPQQQQQQTQPQQQQRIERPQPIQQAPQQRMESPQKEQQTPQRMERSQAQPERVERTQSAPPQRSSSSEGRSSRGESSGRQGRGEN